MSKKRLKILYVITKSNWGGAQRYVHDLVTNLPREEYDAAVAVGGNEALLSKLENKSIRVISLKSLQRDINIFKEFIVFFELLSLYRKEQPDIVHLNSSKAGGLGALAARLRGVPKIIFTAHGWPFKEKRSAIWRLFAFLGSWFTALLSTKVICVSKNDLRAAGALSFVSQKTMRIYNGIDLEMQFGKGDVIRSSFPAGATITGTIGELNKNKNQQTLIEQAKEDPDMNLAIVGEGELRHALQSKIEKYNLEKRVKLFGFMPANEVLKGFDRFALPSHKEGLPYVLLEAKLAGLPIDANRVGGVGEILDTKNVSEFSLEQMLQKTYALYQLRS